MSDIKLTRFIEVEGVKYFPVIGLEIHAEMNTNTKMWCACKNEPDVEEVNVNICPVCMAHPGTLPVPNEQAIINVIKMGLACNSTIANFTEFDRKNYFYPDIPKGYQISQYKYPIVSGGNLGGVDLTRIHLEEDTATSVHDKDDATLINFNRAGVPLMELVTEPVIHDSETAVKFGKEVQLMLKYLDISNADIEKGHMRMEANISLSIDPTKFGTKVEVKNIGSFKSLSNAIEYEFKRHIKCLRNGEKIEQETRGYDEASGTTKSQRSKENSEEYRYFPDPDISKLYLHEDERFSPATLAKTLPELPEQRRARYESLGVKKENAETFVTQQVFGDYFDECIKQTNDIETTQLVSNYIGSDLIGIINKFGVLESEYKFFIFNSKHMLEIAEMLRNEEITSRVAKNLIEDKFQTIAFKRKLSTVNKKFENEEDVDFIVNSSPKTIAEKFNLLQMSDEATLSPIVEGIIADAKNEKSIADYRSGKEQALMALVGQVIKNTNGRANPTVTKDIFVKKLSTN